MSTGPSTRGQMGGEMSTEVFHKELIETKDHTSNPMSDTITMKKGVLNECKAKYNIRSNKLLMLYTNGLVPPSTLMILSSSIVSMKS